MNMVFDLLLEAKNKSRLIGLRTKNMDFEEREDQSVLLKDSGRKKFLTAWQEKKQEEITHPFLEEKIKWGLVPYIQALLLARTLRKDLEEYPAFLWK